MLCYLQGRTQDEAAAILGIAKGTLKMRLEQARALLRTRLVRRGLGPAALLAASAWPAAAQAAGVPLALIGMTVQASLRAAAGPVSVKVAALAKGVLRAMMMSKLKAVVAVVLALGFLISGATILSCRTAAAQSDQAPLATTTPPTLSDKPPTAQVQVDSIKGTWELVSSVYDGEPRPPERKQVAKRHSETPAATGKKR
ncbi:MAG: hypothetical protein L0215_03070 [Gemmataceae bacterium]|nr:hypothetical protein [Gemmataceae bacterium]